MQCIVPLLANAGLLLNAGTPHWRRNIFWMLIAMSCTLWMIGQFQWTYHELYLHKPLPDLNGGDILFFLRGIPMMAALALRPHRRRGEIQLRFGYLDFVLLFTWWTFLYAFAVLPWIYASPMVAQYNYNYNLLANIQNMIIAAGLAALWLSSSGIWRLVYANLFGATTLYLLTSLVINVGIPATRTTREVCMIFPCFRTSSGLHSLASSLIRIGTSWTLPPKTLTTRIRIQLPRKMCGPLAWRWRQ